MIPATIEIMNKTIMPTTTIFFVEDFILSFPWCLSYQVYVTFRDLGLLNRSYKIRTNDDHSKETQINWTMPYWFRR
jgi:hypothetical protein